MSFGPVSIPTSFVRITIVDENIVQMSVFLSSLQYFPLLKN